MNIYEVYDEEGDSVGLYSDADIANAIKDLCHGDIAERAIDYPTMPPEDHRPYRIEFNRNGEVSRVATATHGAALMNLVTGNATFTAIHLFAVSESEAKRLAAEAYNSEGPG